MMKMKRLLMLFYLIFYYYNDYFRFAALTQMGFRFSEPFIKFLVAKSDPVKHSQVSVDQFIVLCIQIQRFTEAFRARDAEQKGIISIQFEDFLQIALTCST